ncbi:hypothetical protein FE257_008234 [Aspergillus nanangensis]|uniref:Uncharacterized protein n=1 Tax=Aspergillus nanangensis TaxID=2582783 RepID=A0AAD4GTP9_ASPNN|nr:hypothetical protein FE257_008234 [Aspergillus nanangensis]
MATSKETAFVTGGASGIGRAVALMLASKNIRVYIADQDEAGAESIAKETNGFYSVVDVTSWESQLAAFSRAVSLFGRVDYVFPIAGIGENVWLPQPSSSLSTAFEKPNLQVLDVNVAGAMYTFALAIQQFRHQERNHYGFRGKVRSAGKALLAEGITLNSFNPNAIRTNISTGSYYESLEAEGLLTPLSGVVDVCAHLLGDNEESGECFEIGPNYDRGQGFVKVKFAPLEDEAQIRVFEKLKARGAAKHHKL